MSELAARRCAPCPPGTPPLRGEALAAGLAELPGWAVDGDALVRTFRFPDYARVIAFVNAVAAIAEREDHHPDLAVGYDRVEVRWTTHSVGGLSVNDLVCAAKVDALA